MYFDVKFGITNQTFDADFGKEIVLGNVQGGQNGATFIPYVSPDGVISWTNDRELPNPTPVNIKGAKGDQGERGLQGVQGIPGEKGETGAKGDPGEQGIQGEKGEPGQDGQPGKDGADGKNPIKGEDYFTEADKAEMVTAVIAALPVYGGEIE